MLLANYASDSDSDADSDTPSAPVPAPKPAPAPAPAPARAAAKPKRKGPLKITLDLPKPAAGRAGDSGDEEERDVGKDVEKDREEVRPVKKAKLVGAGSSSLLGMLPAPKRKLPTSAPKPGLAVNKAMARPAVKPVAKPAPADDSDDDDRPDMIAPARVVKAAKRKEDEEELDLFGLSSAAPKPKPTLPTASPRPPSVTSAPAVADFVPPEPTAQDPYPGYYQLPSGEWAAHDPAYYAQFFPSASSSSGGEKAARDDARASLGRDWLAFDDGRADVVDVNATSGIAEARAAEERRQQAAQRPRLPGDEFEYKPIGQTKGLANERHQLTSLLHNAFSQRDELEARIAQNKKNMRMAGQKYGF